MKKRRDLRLLIAAVVLLVAGALWVVWSSQHVRERREATIKGVPEFPAPGQKGPQLRKLAAPRVVEAKPVKPAPPTPAPRPAARHDPMLSFVQGQGAGVALVHVNALFNTPVFDRLQRCLPKEFQKLETEGKSLGIDVTRDVDQVAMSPGGMAVSGFFEGKPVAEKLIPPGADREDYRGATLLTSQGRCSAQLGNLVVLSPTGDCKSLIDRALSDTPEGATDEVYGDIYMRSELKALRGADVPPEVRTLVDGLSGMTMRANVWDSIAVSLEGQPVSGKDATELAQIARGAMRVAKGQIDDEDVELQALADLASVDTSSGKLDLNLALPIDDLFEKLHFPCPGMAGDAGH
jgi:hypothetical protein